MKIEPREFSLEIQSSKDGDYNGWKILTLRQNKTRKPMKCWRREQFQEDEEGKSTVRVFMQFTAETKPSRTSQEMGLQHSPFLSRGLVKKNGQI